MAVVMGRMGMRSLTSGGLRKSLWRKRHVCLAVWQRQKELVEEWGRVGLMVDGGEDREVERSP